MKNWQSPAEVWEKRERILSFGKQRKTNKNPKPRSLLLSVSRITSLFRQRITHKAKTTLVLRTRHFSLPTTAKKRNFGASKKTECPAIRKKLKICRRRAQPKSRLWTCSPA